MLKRHSITQRWFSGKTALVTGASSGIGRAIAHKLLGWGTDVLACGRDTTALESLRTDSKQTPGKIIEIFSADFSQPHQLHETAIRIKSNHRIDLLINNAGLSDMRNFIRQPFDSITALEYVNIGAVIFLCHIFLPSLTGRKGTGILNLGSTASFFATPGSALYGASKHFILGFTDALHQEMLAQNVHVTGLYPGTTHSKFLERATAGRYSAWKNAMDASVVAEQGLHGLARNKIRVIPGISNRIKVSIASLVPPAIILQKIYKDLSCYQNQPHV